MVHEVALHCRAVVKRYGDVVAVDGLDLEVTRGECFGLLGPNGAGKTTTIEMLEGLLTPDAGEVRVLGMQWARDARALRPRLGIQLQETRLSEKLSVVETLRLFRSFYPQGPTVAELLALVGLEAKRDASVGKLSGGQKQRLSVACALVGRPDVLFLDEPTTGLDPQSRLQLWDVLERFKAAGGTILLTTHYMDEAATLCDRVVELIRAVEHHAPVLEQAGEDAVHDGGADLALDVVADDRHAGVGELRRPLGVGGDEHRDGVDERHAGVEAGLGVVLLRLLGARPGGRRPARRRRVAQRLGHVDRLGRRLLDGLAVVLAEPVEASGRAAPARRARARRRT